MDVFDPIYQQAGLPWVLAALLAANVVAFTRLRYETALREPGIDFAALSFYQLSGTWLAAWLFLVTATLPDRFGLTLGWVVTVAAIAGYLVVRVRGRA